MAYLEDVPGEDEDPLHRLLLVLCPLGPVLAKDLGHLAREALPQPGIGEGGLVLPPVGLELEVVLPRHLVLGQLLAEEQDLRVGEVDEEAEDELEEVGVVLVVPDQGDEVGLHDLDLAEGPADGVVVVVSTELLRNEYLNKC